MDEIAKAEAALEAIEPGYLDTVRSAATRLGVRGDGPDPVRDAIRDVQDLVQIDIEPPTNSAQPAGRAVKNLVKRSVQWYMRYVATQISALGEALVSLSGAMADRLDTLEDSNRRLRSDVEELKRRVGAIEPPDRRTN